MKRYVNLLIPFFEDYSLLKERKEEFNSILDSLDISQFEYLIFEDFDNYLFTLFAIKEYLERDWNYCINSEYFHIPGYRIANRNRIINNCFEFIKLIKHDLSNSNRKITKKRNIFLIDDLKIIANNFKVMSNGWEVISADQMEVLHEHFPKESDQKNANSFQPFSKTNYPESIKDDFLELIKKEISGTEGKELAKIIIALEELELIYIGSKGLMPFLKYFEMERKYEGVRKQKQPYDLNKKNDPDFKTKAYMGIIPSEIKPYKKKFEIHLAKLQENTMKSSI